MQGFLAALTFTSASAIGLLLPSHNHLPLTSTHLSFIPSLFPILLSYTNSSHQFPELLTYFFHHPVDWLGRTQRARWLPGRGGFLSQHLLCALASCVIVELASHSLPSIVLLIRFQLDQAAEIEAKASSWLVAGDFIGC